MGVRSPAMGRFHRHADGTVHEHDARPRRESDHRDVGDHSGYTETGVSRVAVLEDILSENDRVADANRHDFAHAGVRVGQPHVVAGRGQDRPCSSDRSRRSADRVRVGILEGDIATSLDADGSTASARRSRSSTRAPASAASAISTRRWCASGLRRLPLDRTRPARDRERRQPRVPGGVRRRRRRAGDGVLGDRGRGEAAQVPGDVPRGRRGRRQQDRPAPAPRLRPRPVPRQPRTT